MKFVQIIHDRVHWVTPYKTKDEIPEFAPDIIIIQAPDNVQEQWFFDEATNSFHDPSQVFYYVDIDDDGYVRSLFKSYTELEIPEGSRTPMRYDPTLHTPNETDVFYNGEFIDDRHYISRRLDEIRDLLTEISTR